MTLPNVSAPTVLTEYSTPRVLTMEWVEGVRVTDTAALRRLGLRPAALVPPLVACTVRQMLDTGFVHADPHAGNLRVTPNGTLVYLDFGMMVCHARPTSRGLAPGHACPRACPRVASRDPA